MTSKAKPLERFEGGFAGLGLDHFEAGVGQAFGNHAAKRLLVIDEQQMSF